ncbi:hypothetical protein BJ912DRAFT_582106 [Pholiota molesta]|nr:hypothetical protein BJ912DRAFT_582106 [Pholiota molesta]
MAKRKWYVVTVGRDIGVFPTWLAVCPLVEGVSGASHQSFTSEAEARRMFAEEQAKGNTRIIREDETKQSSPRKAYNKPTHSNPGSTSALPRSPTESSIVVYPEYQYGEPSRRFETPMRRFEIIDSFFNKESPSSNRHTQVSTPTSTSMRSVRIQDNSPEIIVKTPPWVSSYPKALKESQVLSPLDNPSLLSLRSFKEGSRHGTPVQSIQRLHNADVDPRSPIINASQAELMSMNSLSFARPSPSMRRSRLPFEYANTEAGILFRPNPAIVG